MGITPSYNFGTSSNFYLEALDRDIRKPDENPSVGIILQEKTQASIPNSLTNHKTHCMIRYKRLYGTIQRIAWNIE